MLVKGAPEKLQPRGQLNSLWTRQNGWHFRINLHERWFLSFDLNFIELYIYICLVWFGFNNGLALNRWQAIIWTNDGIVHWHICITRPQWDSCGLNITIDKKYSWWTVSSQCILCQKISISISINHNTEVLWTCFHLTKVIYNNCVVFFYTLFLISALCSSVSMRKQSFLSILKFSTREVLWRT